MAPLKSAELKRMYMLYTNKNGVIIIIIILQKYLWNCCLSHWFLIGALTWDDVSSEYVIHTLMMLHSTLTSMTR